ncbi:pectin lyase-like protein [Thozetella sp. PMI_491]|nr:pectin lyase-like protein [Thozetella sp. PMI_491]
MKITLSVIFAQAALFYTTGTLAKEYGSVFARNVTGNTTLAEAERIVLLAQEEARQRNERLVNNVRKNKYEFREALPAPPSPGDDSATGVNNTVATAAALVAEAQMMNETVSGLLDARQAASYWMADMVQNGRSPMVSDSAYKVWRNIKDCGAVGDGVTDNTAAINRAIADGNRCGLGCGSSSTLFAVVYFPPGTYLVSSSIIQYFMTQFVSVIFSILYLPLATAREIV